MPLFRSRAAEKAEDTKAKLDVARAQIRLLEHELALAEQTEAERAASARADAERSRWRAIRHEINALLKAALEFEVGYARCVSAFDRMVAAGDSAKKLLRLTSREEQWLADAMAASALRSAALRDMGRQGYRPPHLHMASAPGATVGGIGHHGDAESPERITSLSQSLRQVLLRQYDCLAARTASLAREYAEHSTPDVEHASTDALRADAENDDGRVVEHTVNPRSGTKQ
jgi:hypothetical protein